MHQIGSAIKWSTLNARHPVAGVCESWSYKAQRRGTKVSKETGDRAAMIRDILKAEFRYTARVDGTSTDFLDLSTGPVITISGITSGVVCALKAVERWQIGANPKKIEVSGNHYPLALTVAEGSTASRITAITPTQTSLAALVTPGDELVYGTSGLSHGSGILVAMTLTQAWSIGLEQPNEDGDICGVIINDFIKTIELEMAASGDPPEEQTRLDVAGAPDHAVGFRIIEPPEASYTLEQAMVYKIQAELFEADAV